jgi:hypothetical protein
MTCVLSVTIQERGKNWSMYAAIAKNQAGTGIRGEAQATLMAEVRQSEF